MLELLDVIFLIDADVRGHLSGIEGVEEAGIMDDGGDGDDDFLLFSGSKMQSKLKDSGKEQIFLLSSFHNALKMVNLNISMSEFSLFIDKSVEFFADFQLMVEDVVIVVFIEHIFEFLHD